MSILNRIERGRASRPPRLLLYGTEGIGKSCFASCAPHPIFIRTEDGLDAISCDKFPLAASRAEVTTILGGLHAEEHDFQTVCIDSLHWLERLIWDRVCQDFGVKRIGGADGG